MISYKVQIDDEKFHKFIKNYSNFAKTFYLDLGVKIVRVFCYCEEFIPYIEKHLTYSVKENSDSYDTTLILWQEPDYERILKIPDWNLPEYTKSRISMTFYPTDNSITMCSDDMTRVYYGMKNFDEETVIRDGHFLVEVISKIINTETSCLVHGACIGTNGNGVLLCALGKRGKSTLAVNSMLSGFEYVGEDYLILSRENDNLFAYPIYSIVLLSHKMYNDMYKKLEGTRFVSNNETNDKYVINIANFHSQFRQKYPVKMCMFLEFTEEKEPEIKECTKGEKGTAITQMAYTTIDQMADKNPTQTIKKIINMLNVFSFYKISLCNDIAKNTEYLRQFLKEWK